MWKPAIFKPVLLFAAACLASHALAADVHMAFGEKIPPFCFPESNSGIELEVIGESLAYKGHRLVPHYFPFARVPVAFIGHQVDAAMTDLGRDMTKEGGHYGDPAVFYDNVFITLKARHLHIEKPADLRGLTVISFQGAANRYPDWLGPLRRTDGYFEENDQSLQVKTLMKGRYDAVLSDRNIFKYFSLKLAREGFPVQEIEEHAFTKVNPMDYRPVFRDPQVRDDFNEGLKHLKQTGRYQQIYDRYLK